MDWQPQPGPLQQLAEYLRDSLSGYDAAAQKNAEQMLRQAKSSPDINNYLTYLCVTPSSPTGMDSAAWHAARTAGAIYLKNNVKQSYRSIEKSSQSYIKSAIVIGLGDRHSQIRNYAGNVITEIVRQGGVLDWPQVLPDLASIVANEDGRSPPEAQDGAMGALSKICEDNKRQLDHEYQSQRPMAFLLPKLLEFTACQNAKIRTKALGALNMFLTDPMTLTARDNMNIILPRVVQLTADENEDVRRFVCRSFALLADAMPTVLQPHIEGIVDYTLSQQKNLQNQELALDAAEFFFEASSATALRDALGPYLQKIVPVLLECMIYSEDDQVRLEGDEDDADIEDEDKDIKPQFAAAKGQRSGGPGSSAATESDNTDPSNKQEKPSINGYAYEDDDGLSEGEIDDDDLDFDPEDEWNLRKCSAASLDSLASRFGAPVFNITLPWLMDNLAHKHWPNREAAVLTLGAIGPGCVEEIKPHLPKLVPYMLSLLADQQHVVRQITCWALSRFAGWASHLDLAGKQEFFEPMMDGILQRMLDKNKKVQESAASAFATLEESADIQLAPYCQIIIQQFVRCFGCYKDKNMYILYDCIQTLTEHAGPTLAQPEIVDILMPALITRWEKVKDESREIFPLLECLAFVATALGNQFSQFAKPFFMRSIKIIHTNLEESANAPTSAWAEQPEKDFLVTSLDLLSSIIQALEEARSAELAAAAQPDMFQLLAYCMKDNNNDVKQSAYALLGDCAIYIFAQLQPYLSTIMELIIAQLDLNQTQEDPETAFRVINNACWSCGEIAMRGLSGMSPFIERLLPKLVFIMFSKQVPESLNENAAIALGRIGVGCHEQLAPHLLDFALPFLSHMQRVSWTDEKGHAYKGFGLIVLDNPEALENCLVDFVMQMASAPGLFLTGMQDDGPLNVFEKVLAQYKQILGDRWNNLLNHLSPQQEQALRQLYNI